MITLTFVTADGSERQVRATEGVSVMKAAANAGIEGVFGDCGGNLICATCHAYIDAEWRGKLKAPSEMELTMLDCTLDVTEDSRLTCQILVSPALDGMVIRVPSS